MSEALRLAQPEFIMDMAEAADDQVDTGDQVDIDELVTYAGERLRQMSGKPTAAELDQLLTYLAENSATDAVIEEVIEDIGAVHMQNATRKELERMASTVRKDWRRAVREEKERLDELRRQNAVTRTLMPDTGPTDEERATVRAELWPAVRDIAEDADILGLVIDRLRASGIVGETDALRLLYLAGTSRVMVRPVCPLVTGASSGGKSQLVRAVLSTFPEEDIHTLTSSSALSLIYDDRPLKHKILFIAEASQLENDPHSMFAMMVRELISEGRLIHRTTVEDENAPYGRRLEEIVKEGPIVNIVTTTSSGIHEENETRMLRWNIAETTEQTAAVMQSTASAAADTGTGPDFTDLQNFQRWIAAGPRRAVVPFANKLASKVPPIAVRFRRDFGALISLISAHALLHAATRDTDAFGNVIATLDDYSAVRRLAAIPMAMAVGRMPSERTIAVVKHIERLLLLGDSKAATSTKPAEGTRPTAGRRKPGPKPVAGIVDGDTVTVSSRLIGSSIGLDQRAASRGVTAAITSGFLVNLENMTRKPYRLRMGPVRISDLETGDLLPSADDLK